MVCTALVVLLWYPDAGWSTSASACVRISHHPSQTTTYHQHASNQSNTTHEITQQMSRKLLRMDVLTSETCCALNNEIQKASDIKLVSLYSTIKMMHGQINIRFTFSCLVAKMRGTLKIQRWLLNSLTCAYLRYLGTTETSYSCVQDEIRPDRIVSHSVMFISQFLLKEIASWSKKVTMLVAILYLLCVVKLFLALLRQVGASLVIIPLKFNPHHWPWKYSYLTIQNLSCYV